MNTPACRAPVRSRSLRASAPLLGALLCLTLGSTGCLYSRYQTDTARSSTEQLLVAESIERAVGRLALPDVQGKTVSLDLSAVPSDFGDYVLGSLAARLGGAGARVVSPDQAELRISVLAGSAGTTSRRTSFGLPSIPLPSIGATPEIPLIGITRQRGWTRLRLQSWDRSGRLLSNSPTVTEGARFDVTSVLFLEFRSNDIYPGEGRQISATGE